MRAWQFMRPAATEIYDGDDTMQSDGSLDAAHRRRSERQAGAQRTSSRTVCRIVILPPRLPAWREQSSGRLTMNIAIRAAIAILSIASIGTAYADSEGGQNANTQFTSIPGFLAQAPAQNAPAVATAQNGQVVRAYVTQSSHGRLARRAIEVRPGARAGRRPSSASAGSGSAWWCCLTRPAKRNVALCTLHQGTP
jgi:hypothetical protein